uniref:Large ribosomal subunit protein uL23c n=1 Tax=Stephanosphaera pluvialis TaxID=51712 RepID=A0A0S2IDJ7_9CHLO|nr:ribosomal protein L23 [Stephanosphaera pluvialis]
MTEKTDLSVKDKNEIKVSNVKKDFTIKSMIDLIKYPVITEKTSVALSRNRQYTFDVDKRLSKKEIKKIFEELFNVNVVGINTHIPPRKTVRVGMARGFRPLYKRAIITLQKNQSINYNLSNSNK